MVYYIGLYFLCGVLFNFVYDLLIDLQQDEEHRFTWTERLSVVLIWPIATLIFLFYFFKAFFTND